MQVFRSIVETPVGPVLDSHHNVTLGRAIRTSCDDPLGQHASFLQLPDQHSPRGSAEVMGGLVKALNDYQEKDEAAWKR